MKKYSSRINNFIAMQKQKKKKSPNRGKEVDRILKDNLERGMIAKENILYEADLPSIGDDTATAPTDFTPDRNQADFEGALEPETDPNSFDVQGTEPGKSAEDFSNIYVKKCIDWVKKINEFSEWLNGLEGASLNKEINEADREGSIFRGVTRKVGDNVTKIAGELERLGSQLSGYVVSAPKKQRELQKLTKIT